MEAAYPVVVVVETRWPIKSSVGDVICGCGTYRWSSAAMNES